MPECPFCHVGVEEELVLYGGSCPHCFNAIPGEEAPTDPGGPVLEAQPDASNAPVKSVVFAVLLCVGGGGLAIQQFSKEPGDSAVISQSEEALPVRERDLEAEARAMTDAYLALNPQDTQRTAEEPNETVGTGQARTAALSPVTPTVYPRGTGSSTRSSEGSGEATPDRPSFSSAGGPVVVPRRARLEPDPLSDPDEVAEAITHTLRANSGRFEQCYNQRLKNNERLRGAWMVSFTVMPSGAAQGVRVRALTMQDGELEACLGRQMSELHFPKISEPSVFARKYHFGVR